MYWWLFRWWQWGGFWKNVNVVLGGIMFVYGMYDEINQGNILGGSSGFTWVPDLHCCNCWVNTRYATPFDIWFFVFWGGVLVFWVRQVLEFWWFTVDPGIWVFDADIVLGRLDIWPILSGGLQRVFGEGITSSYFEFLVLGICSKMFW